jgi:hypothetical protein
MMLALDLLPIDKKVSASKGSYLERYSISSQSFVMAC